MKWETLRDLAERCALSLLAVGDAAPLPDVERDRLAAWQKAGYAGDMRYMERDPELFVSPRRMLESTLSVVSLAVAYDNRAVRAARRGEGRVARYAWGRDYHTVLRERLADFTALVASELGRPIEHRAFSDSVPLLERAFAARGGRGFRGKNTLLIVPRTGSLFFLAELLWNVRVTGAPEPAASSRSCGGCTNCLVSCPTDAFPAPHVLDARKCISYLSIEKRGMLEPWERRALGGWIFGCDICQEVCPFNHAPMKIGRGPGDDRFGAGAGAGPFLSLEAVLDIRDDGEFRARFRGSPILRAKRAGLLRNAAAVAANTEAHCCLPALSRTLREDASPVVRAHALWAAVSLLGPASADARRLLEASQHDPAAEVQGERKTILEEHDANERGDGGGGVLGGVSDGMRAGTSEPPGAS